MSEDKTPLGWKNVKLGDLLEKIIGGGTPSRDLPHYWNGSVPWATVKDLKKSILHDASEYITEQGLVESSANIIPEGTLIIATRMALGKAVFFTKPVAINQDLKALFPIAKVCKEFLFHWFNWKSEVIEGMGSGSTVKGIRLEVLKALPLILPPLSEQRKIAEILSTVDGKIEVIGEQIEQMQELKRGLMQQLLTKGIGHTRYKDSPLGPIPENWQVASLEEITLPKVGLKRGPFGGALKKEVFVESGYKVYEQRNAIYKNMNLGSYYVDAVKFQELNGFEVVSGDLIVSCSGTIGRIAMIPEQAEKGIINQALLRIRLDSTKINTSYFFQLFESEFIQSKIIDSTQGGAMKNLVGMSEFRKTAFCCPPLQEQERIAQILTTVDDKMDVLHEKKSQYHELKKGLMQQLLTGKLRVNHLIEQPELA